MRITQYLTFNRLQNMLNRNRSELAKFQEQLSSGKAVVRASDDNVAFSTSRIMEEQIRKDTQYQSNVNSGLRQARSVQDSLDGVIDSMIDLKNLAVQGANDSLNDVEREKLAEQVASVRDRLVDLGNTQLNNVYLFGGTNSKDPTFSADAGATGGVADISNGDALTTRITENTTVETTVTGSELRNTPAGDLFGIVENLETALRNNDRAAVNSTITDIEDSLDHVTRLTSRIGSTINRLEFVHDKLESGIIEKKGEVSRLTDTDFAEAMSNFQKYETSYEAALAAHSRMTGTTLLNYL